MIKYRMEGLLHEEQKKITLFLLRLLDALIGQVPAM